LSDQDSPKLAFPDAYERPVFTDQLPVDRSTHADLSRLIEPLGADGQEFDVEYSSLARQLDWKDSRRPGTPDGRRVRGWFERFVNDGELIPIRTWRGGGRYRRNLKPRVDPLLFVLSWQLQPEHNHVARVMALHTGPDNRCRLSVEEIQDLSRRSAW